MTLDLTSLSLIVGIISALLGGLIGAGVMWHNYSYRLGQMDLKIDLIWDAIMKDAIAKAVQKGVATMNSPIIFSPEPKEWFGDMKEELQKIYRSKAKWTASALHLEIQKYLGDRILKEVAIPHNIEMLSALLIASEVAKS